MATRDVGGRGLLGRFDDWLDEETSPRRALAVYGVLAVYFGFLLLPIAWLILSTLMSTEVMYSGRVVPAADELTLRNYAHVLARPEFRRYFVNSTVVATATTALTLVFGTLAGYALSRFEFPGRSVLLLGYISTQMLPWVLVLIPFFLLMFELGLVDSFTGIVLAHTAFALPFATWMLKGYFDDIPESLDDAAKMDGCSQVDVLWRVILPLSAPGMAVAGFYTFVLSWNDYLAVSVLSQTAATRTLPFGLQLFQTQNQINWGLVLTAAVITMVPVILLFAVVQRWLVEGLANGGMKGT
ncbi:carbohydrate ABC transporter permease [Halegenticoccus soli]|uniref:carbohydrate ABC transporter permease n=1 Tax=Halegenticoccus soli TaxID=1985678 RepID=UPI000C6CB01A|nr:carbohydrate ABC transporter permease [Halegenticoccus soli]